MEAIGVAASLTQLIEVTVKTVKYLNSVREASKDRAGVLREASALLPLLVNLQTQVSDAKQSETWFCCIGSLAVGNGPLDQLREALAQLTKRLKPKKGIENAARALIWTLDKAYCDELLWKIERVKSRISLALQGDTFRLAQAIKADTASLGTIGERVASIADDVTAVQHSEDVQKRQAILAWFSPLNFFNTQQDLFARREEGTGQWLIDSTEFRKWTSGMDRILCCPGIPGAGKSILASVVVDFLRKDLVKTGPTGVAAIYCNFKERELQTSENLLAGACVQLMNDSSEPLSTTLVKLYEIHSRTKTRPTCKEILEVFDSIARSLNNVYVVVDALDECSGEVRTILLSRLEALPDNVKLMVTTRHIEEIIYKYRDSLRIEVRATDIDLKTYIKSRIATNGRLMRHVQDHPALEQQICERVTTKAEGMFLAAKLHVDSLSTKTSVKLLKKALENLSSTLDELYDDAIQRIDTQSQDDRQLARKALRWVAYTYRPLGVLALQEAVAIEPGEDNFDHEGKPPLGLILDVCTGLLTADEENEIVRLVHYTAQDYFDKLAVSSSQDAHALIAGDCITYLSYKSFQMDDPSANEGAPYLLLAYASTFWATHAMARRTPELDAQIQRYLASNPRVCLRTIEEHDRFRFSNANPDFILSRLQTCHGSGVAAFFGLHAELRVSLKHMVDIDQSVYFQDSALHLAARNDKVQTVHILLDHGADIENKNVEEDTPLHVAVGVKALAVARVLISRGANVMAEDCHFMIPFTRVSWSSPRPFLEYLLAAGTTLEHGHLLDISSLTESIIDKDDIPTFQWLCESVPEAPVTTSIQSTTFVYAAQQGSAYFVNRMLEWGADINSKDWRGDTALHAAFFNSRQLVVMRSLLDHGIDVNCQNETQQTALHRAAETGSEEGLNLLMMYNPDVNKQDHVGFTPLFAAIESYHGNAALILLRSGADPNIRDVNGMTALHIASARGNSMVVQALLEYAATVESRSMFTLTAAYEWLRVPKARYSASDCLLVVAVRQCLRIQLFAPPSKSRPHKHLRSNLLRRARFLEWKVWAKGMTALDIAMLRSDENVIHMLKPLMELTADPGNVVSDEYLCDIFGMSTMSEIQEELLRRERREENSRRGLYP
ncbi:MAG: hypothetical protein Q9172_003757 [Xanthocarpia lactea]